VRGEIIPYIRLRDYFHIRTERPEHEQIMVVETDSGRYGFVVDQVIGNCQTVIKNLGRFYRNVHVASGATILGNGTVALILDLNRLAQEAIQAISLDPRADVRSTSARRNSGKVITDYQKSSGGSAGGGEGASLIQ
jgi:two-component system chemotaxis sensor kinase CheA